MVGLGFVFKIKIMDIQTKFNIRDKVYSLGNSCIVESMVSCIKISISIPSRELLAKPTIHYGLNNLEGITPESRVFKSKQELIDFLIKE